MLSRCPICRRTTRPERHDYCNTGPHQHRIFDGLYLFRCRRCDSMWCPNAPDNGKLQDYYATSYTPARMGHVANDRWPIWDTRSASLIMLARMFMEFKPGDLFLDVGPGNGASLSLAPLMLPQPNLGCVEFNHTSIEFFRRHAPDIRIDQSLDGFAPGSAKVVYSAHSLEHYRPDDASRGLLAIRRVLAPGGVLTLEVPHAPAHRTIVESCHPPHLLFFRPAGLLRLVASVGFEVRMWYTAKGRTRAKETADELSPPDGIGKRLAARLEALNTSDLVASMPRNNKENQAALKLVAVKRAD